jgi:hypothetical protein
MRFKLVRVSVGVIALTALLVACSSPASKPSRLSQSPNASTRTLSPAGPSAELRGPIGGNNISLQLPSSVNLTQMHYHEQEWFASGTAHSYRAVGTLADNGEWTVAPSGSAP